METNKVYAETISETIKALSDKLGVKADQIFATIKKQASIEFRINICFMIGYIALFIFGYNLLMWSAPFWDAKEGSLPSGQQFKVIAASIIAIILMLVSALQFFTSIEDVVTLKFNPEYWALNNLLSKLK